MIAIPAAVLIALAVIAVAWSPLFALVIAVPAFLVFLAVVSMRPRADEKATPPTGSAETYEDDTPKGAWGEPRPNG